MVSRAAMVVKPGAAWWCGAALVAGLVAGLLPGTTVRGAGEDAPATARGVMEEQLRRHKPARETAVWQMVLIDRHGKRKERDLKQLRLTAGNDVDQVLIFFLAPADIRGTALLTQELPGEGENGQWLYLPSLQKLQRVAQGRRNGYFMGSDFTYEDLDPDDLASSVWRFLPEETVAGSPCFVIEAAPADDRQRQRSGYAKRIFRIRKDNCATLSIDYYDRDGARCKTQTNREFSDCGNGVCRARVVEMDNPGKNHRTILEIRSLDFQADVPASAFSRQQLTTGRYLE